MDMEATTSSDFVIRAINVPPEFFEDRDVAKKYFRRFGKVKLVMFKPKRKALVIEYTNESSMLDALSSAGEYNGQIFKVSRDTQTLSKKKVKKDPDPDWTGDPEVRAELVAMGAFPSRNYDLRSNAMIVDSPVIKVKQTKWKSASSTHKPIKKTVGTKDALLSSEAYDLVHLTKQQALTLDDKFKILDARDKLIRIQLKKNIEFSKIRATVGTCPDMCPEKERLLREIQHQVALYEQEGTKEMNARLGVKQYSRSSADQEAPLPQELRPVAVLQMTMGYLMHRIMGLCDTPDVNVAEWYHFLWDRTRGIRKDITQQELCCQGSVELVEHCARFHIFCSARLVAEDPSVFDQRINTENLTKCLQTLKYMYHDLQVKGETCQNEAEFRAYIILLNLNDGNFMWEVQQLSKDIQQSEHVSFALKVYSSLDKNNYVKFFKLVSSTTFLNACILMRYFIQVRLSATKTLLKSYSPRVSQTSLPISYITRILAFESAESATEFFETYGLYTNVDRNRLILDKPSLTAPEYPYILDRAIHLVESKRKLSVGEIVCGKQLPQPIFETHVPQDSFTIDGYLKSRLETDEVDVSMEEDEPIKVPEVEEEIEDVAVSTANQIDFTPPQNNIFSKPEAANQISTSKSLWLTPPSNFATQKNIFGGEIVPLPPPKVAEETVELMPLVEEENIEQRRQEEEKIRQQIEEERKKKELQDKLIREQRRLDEARKAEEIKQLAEKQRREKENREYMQIKLVVADTINFLVNAVETYIAEQKLTEISRRIHHRKLKSVITHWRERTRNKRKRKAIDFNPPWFAGTTLQEAAEELRLNSQSLALSSIKRYKRGYAAELHVREKKINKIDLCELTYNLLCKKYLEMDTKLRNELFWKVTISLPNESEFNCGLNHVERILESCFKWKERNSVTVLIEQSKLTPTITYCLEKQKGLVINYRNDTNGFIFIANELNDNLHRRIVHNFKNYGVFVKIPIVLVLQNYKENKSNLQTMIQEGIISDYLIIVDKFTSKNLTNILEEALIFLATRVEKAPPLQMDTLKSFLMKYLCSDVWKRAKSFSKWNSGYKNCLKDPNTAIYLYNEGLRRLKTVLLDESCKEHSKFPEIFKEFLRNEIPDSLPCDYKYFPSFWNNSAYIKHVEEVLDGLQLPNFLENWPPTNQLQLELSISKYCAQIVKQPQTLFYKTMSILLAKIHSDFKDVLWVDVVELLATEKLNQTNFSLYGTGFVNKSIYNQLIVVYDVNTLAEYATSDWFYINNPIIKHKILLLLQEEKPAPIPCTSSVFEDFDLDQIFTKIQEPKKHNVAAIKNELASCTHLLHDLENSVVVHKKILEKSGQFLKTVLE